MSSFRKLEIQANRIVKSLVELSGLDEQLVANIVQYAKCLPKDGITYIDEPIFTAQMIRHFNMTNSYMISSLYRSLRYTVAKDVRLKDFCRCICTFLTANLNLKSDFVFHVYDINGDGELSSQELFNIVKTNVVVFDNEMNENDDSSPVKELAEIAMRLMGIGTDSPLTVEKFRQLVHHESLCLDILGQVLPTSHDCQKFKDKISKLTPFQVHRMFQFERLNCLGEKKMPSLGHFPEDLLRLLDGTLTYLNVETS